MGEQRTITRRTFIRQAAIGAAVATAGLNSGFADAAAEEPPKDKSNVRNYNPDMEYRRLGRTGLWVSAVGLGGRDGRKELRLYRKSGPQGREFSHEILDEGIGPTQIVVVDRGQDSAGLIVAAHGVNEVRIYNLTE